MRRCLAILLLFAVSSHAQLYATLVIPTVEVGNPGNANDSTGFGGVNYVYRIGKHEVTNAQYVEFLNAADPTGANALNLYSTLMTSNANGGIERDLGAAIGSRYRVKDGRENNPVALVSWYSSLRFANWMHNGQGSGSTETGAYTLLGGSPIPSNGATITRNPGATWFLPSENEWYKAAYHKNDGVTGNYLDFPTQTDASLFSDEPPGGGSPDSSMAANFFKNDGVMNGYDDGYAVTESPTFSLSENYLTNKAAYTQAASAYGTFDQGGNVAEWTEAFFGMDMLERSIRGGSWFSFTSGLLASTRAGEEPQNFFSTIGFRIGSTAIPEPSPLLLCGLVASLGGIVHCCATWCRRRSMADDSSRQGGA
jgi:formylglycine-generating enzyme required for sulfatase activity